MSTAPDGASRSPRDPALAASPRRSAKQLQQGLAGSRRASAGAKPATGASTGRAARDRPARRRTFDWMGLASIAIPIVALPISFFVWYSIISLGSFPNDQRAGDLVVGLLLTALFHAVVLLGVLFAITSIRAARRAGRWGIAGWIGIVLGVLVIVYWELLVSPWIVDLWNKATGAA